MDREISKEIRIKEKRKSIIKWVIGIGSVAGSIVLVLSLIQPTLKMDDVIVTKVDKGIIEVSVNASGKVIPAFEEIINSPINSRILEIYKRGGDSVDVGTPILKLDL